jgi:sugar phosphate isomerase/epimerase
MRLAYWDPVAATPDIGISTSAYASLLLPNALERIGEHASLVEIRSFGLHTLLSKRNRAAAAEAGLSCTVHGPFGHTGIWDLDETVRLESLEEHRRHLEASAEIGARLYVAHPDWLPEIRPRDPLVVSQLCRSFETLREWQDGPRARPRRRARRHQRLPRRLAGRPACAAPSSARA